MVMERAREKEFMSKHKGLGGGSLLGSYDSYAMMLDPMMIGSNHTMGGMGGAGRCTEFMPWKLYPIHLPIPSKIIPGSKSQEKQIQAVREHSTMAAFFHPAMLVFFTLLTLELSYLNFL